MRKLSIILNHLGFIVTVLSLVLGSISSSSEKLMLPEYGPEGLTVVNDPWEPVQYAGIIMMMAGAVCLLFTMPVTGDKKLKIRAIVVSTLLAAAFFVFTLFSSGLKLRELPPALQSKWFAPHVVVYMFAYASLTATTILGIIILFRKNTPQKIISLTDCLVYAGTSLFTIGMLIGAIWAKEAWGAFWSWDPKETCAAITWALYLLYIHLRKALPRRHKLTCALLILAFLSLQLCWWGINYIPAAQERSLHTYTKKL